MSTLTSIHWTHEHVRSASYAPLSVSWIEKYSTLVKGIREEILLRVVGNDKTVDELLDGFNASLPAFVHTVLALEELFGESGEPMKGEHIARLIARQYNAENHDELEYDLIAGMKNMTRAFKALARLRDRGLEDAFLATASGKQFLSSQWALTWGIMALDTMADRPDDFSSEDWEFCQLLVVAGPRDTFAFVRGFELAQDDEREEEFDFEPEPVAPVLELVELERVEFHEGERFLSESLHG